MKLFTMMVVAVVAAAVAAGAAESGPAEFEHGVWEFTRVIDNETGTQTLTKKKCTSPSADMRAQREAGAKAGCNTSPTVANGSTYTFTSTCNFAGQEVESTSVMTVTSTSAYSVAIESKAGAKSSKESLVAKRVGDC
jgi:Protein of unknown function (DUF3617)